MSARIINNGATPIKKNSRMPGIKKLLKGEVSNIDKGAPSKVPEGEIMSKPPPPNAPRLKKPSKNSKSFCVFILIQEFGLTFPRKR